MCVLVCVCAICAGNLAALSDSSGYCAPAVPTAREVKAANAHRKAVRGGPFKANAPDTGKCEGFYFDKNPYAGKSLVATSKGPAVKKVTVPFYMGAPPGSMRAGGNNTRTFTKFSYLGEKYRAPPKKKKVPGVFKPISNPKAGPTASIVVTNVRRSVNPSNLAAVSQL